MSVQALLRTTAAAAAGVGRLARLCGASLRALVDVYADERDVAGALSSMAQLNPEAVGGAFEVGVHGRTQGPLHLATRLWDNGDLLPELTPTEAADCLWVITSFDTFDQLYAGRRISRAEVADRLVGLTERAIWHQD